MSKKLFVDCFTKIRMNIKNYTQTIRKKSVV